ncbi:MAG: trans-2-enoyl-CoA reductase family protein [Gammaproteobacteria bacterium]|jgi:enoyl-[acyl-carrier protein] reductase / trans-2-enoyl-CoA reductase (NAD+)|nr:trans-2-enoyl-CoA reductase family protein [Gammaproteobacteria bacterium]MBT4494054.1 trans-2-enoyl-CoA reductase family protein [Gammaproteobacteria bacterium]MBT7370956.1 trans-2-enoyl-CoA reductase family protein [Gammaproteobacteria bacterium]
MIIKPRIRGFLCTTAHPAGCARDVENQIRHVESGSVRGEGPKNVLIIGASGGYGLASRISAAFGYGASTVGVFFERPASGNRTASPGWYKTAAFTEAAKAKGHYAANINGDAYSEEIKQATCDVIERDLGQVDLVIYSLAAPARQMPDGEVVRSTLKPVGEPFEGRTIDFNTGVMRDVSLEPASDEEVADTIKVMGGEDWELWIHALKERGLLAPGCITTNYTYLGSEVTWSIYHHGTIGRAKEDLDRARKALVEPLAEVGGSAYVAVMKGLVTQAASAIPGMSIYLSLLFKAMKDAGTHEGCIEQTTRLFDTQLYGGGELRTDDEGRIRMDELELAPDIQTFVADKWAMVDESNLDSLADFSGYRQAFLGLHGFNIEGTDYEADVELEVDIDLAAGGD